MLFCAKIEKSVNEHPFIKAKRVREMLEFGFGTVKLADEVECCAYLSQAVCELRFGFLEIHKKRENGPGRRVRRRESETKYFVLSF